MERKHISKGEEAWILMLARCAGRFQEKVSEEDDPKRKFPPGEHTMAKRCLTLVRFYFFMSLYALGPF